MTDKEPDLKAALLELLKAIEEAEELEKPCSICGRVILCGVNELCKEDPCGLKVEQ